MADNRNDSSSPARDTALEIICNVCENGAYANLALERTLKKSSLSHQDKNLVTEIVNGTVRMLKHLDWVLNLFLRSHIDKQHPYLRNILRMSLYQILFMDKIPDYASVNHAVEMSRKRANQNLARVSNGVLRNIVRAKGKIQYPQEGKLQYLAVYYSHPEWIVELLLGIFGIEESEKILIYNNQRPMVMVRTNTLKGNREEILEILKKEDLDCRESRLTPWGLELIGMRKAISDYRSYKEGAFYIQNDASMLAAPILAPEKGDIIFDLGCGVGGKTTHLAEYVNKTGQIHAYDIYKKKLALLQANCARLGIENVQSYNINILDIETAELEADKVLLDVPCSGLGVLNRRADARWHRKKEDIAELRKLQSALIKKAGQIVKQGGFLLYSSCTINPAENEEIISEFLVNGEFELYGFAERISFFPLDELDKKRASQGMLTIIPGKYQSDGMFYALLRRNK
jgi:16S rRNA (cytosine967-C5)-methyltransferase